MKNFYLSAIILTLALLIALLSPIKNIQAKNSLTLSAGWENAEINRVGPPPFSIHPVKDPDDFPQAGEDLREFFLDLKVYLNGIFENIIVNFISQQNLMMGFRLKKNS